MPELLKKGVNFFIKTPTWLVILAGTFLVLLQLLNGSIPAWLQLTVFALSLLLTGIPHGALDHLIEAETARRNRKPFKISLFLLKYVGKMLFYAALWYAFPGLSLLFFLILSAWHFGETDIESVPYTPLWNISRFTFGVFILLFLLLSHISETRPLLVRITHSNDHVLNVWNLLTYHKTAIFIISLALVVFFSSIAYKARPVQFNKGRYLRLILLLTLTALLPLLPAFALYFGGWHALSALKAIQSYIKPSETAQMSDKGIGSITGIWLKTLPFTSHAFATFGIGIWYWLYFLKSFDPLPLLFTFLSLITLPHLSVMLEMNKKSVAY